MFLELIANLAKLVPLKFVTLRYSLKDQTIISVKTREQTSVHEMNTKNNNTAHSMIRMCVATVHNAFSEAKDNNFAICFIQNRSDYIQMYIVLSP